MTIANELEEDDVGKVQRIMDVAKSFAPDYDVEEIYEKDDGVMGIVVWDFKVFDLSDQLNMGVKL